ncbi:MAG: hypothetical protein QOG60_934 [Frankiaceae bacterium]|nr:hypothetical protein [Frankiaceae bacterium]
MPRPRVPLALSRPAEVVLGGRVIGPGSPTFVIAEIGLNHNGSVDVGKRLVDAAAAAGADCAKFQMRDLGALYRNGGSADGAGEDLGAQYTLGLLNRFALSVDEMYKLFDHVRDCGLLPLCTPWDMPSLQRLDDYGMAGYKIASADLTNTDQLRAASRHGKPMLMSTGMSEESEIIAASTLLRGAGTPLVLLHCNSTYPTPYKDVNLAYLDRLRELGDCPVGYSGHERGWHIPVAAVARGACVIEKHLTLDRTWEGNDHRVSLLPEELVDMVAAIRDVEAAMGTRARRSVTQGEMMNRVALAKSLVATRDLRPGEIITVDDVEVRSPGRGLQPNRRDELVGRQITRPVAAGEFYFPTDISGAAVPRPYTFARPWGVPVRFHDHVALTARAESNGAVPDLIEFHLSYRDMDLDPSSFFTDPQDKLLAVHSPDVFEGDHQLDLSALDEAHRARSVAELQRVLDLTRTMRRWFTADAEPMVIVSMGGFSSKTPLTADERAVRYDQVARSLGELDAHGVRLLAQTLPPFPWYFGGQMHCNLFVDAADTAAFCERTGLSLCLDVSHSQLTATSRGQSLTAFVERVGRFVEHLHLVDALGVDGEGLQVGEGDVDWPALGAQLRRLAPDASFIPEIWQGHVADGDGFWTALERLEAWF